MKTTRKLIALVCLIGVTPLLVFADDPQPPFEAPKPRPVDEPKSPGEAKPAPYAELSKVIHAKVIEKAPKKYEDASGWGGTIPPPPRVRFPRLRRTVIKVNGEDRFPDGAWSRYRVWIDDPAKDIQVQVLEIKPVEGGLYRVKIAAAVAAHGEGERQRWRNGIKLFGISAQADAVLAAELDIDVKVSFSGGKFIPDLVVEPKVAESRLHLLKFDLNRVGPVGGELVRDLGNDLKGFLETLIKTFEDDVKNHANDALARALKDGKATIPAAQVLKLKAGLATPKAN